jgi:hypothetical protein
MNLEDQIKESVEKQLYDEVWKKFDAVLLEIDNASNLNWDIRSRDVISCVNKDSEVVNIHLRSLIENIVDAVVKHNAPARVEKALKRVAEYATQD